MRWASLAVFFLDSGLGDFAIGDAWEPAFGGNRRRVAFRLASPAEGVSALALAHLN